MISPGVRRVQDKIAAKALAAALNAVVISGARLGMRQVDGYMEFVIKRRKPSSLDRREHTEVAIIRWDVKRAEWVAEDS